MQCSGKIMAKLYCDLYKNTATLNSYVLLFSITARGVVFGNETPSCIHTQRLPKGF